MRRKHGLLIFISSLLVILSIFTPLVSCDESFDNYSAEVSNSAAYIAVPFHYQSNNYYCGPAALEMVFDYYGEDIPQTEIADVARTYPYVTYTDELRRAAHFSNLSTSLGDEMPGNTTGYSARKVGYAAFEQWGLTIDDLKALINKGEPIIVLMWWTSSKVYGHYRVIVGYNETHIIMHDPWNKAWGGTYGGANTSMTYSTFLDLWEYIGNWALWVHPWSIKLQIPSIVNKGESFEVTANITYHCSTPFDSGEYTASSCGATIKLQEGLELVLGETTQHSLGDIVAGNSVQTSWSIQATETGSYNISLTVTGIVEGNVGAHGTYTYYDYEDKIGGSCINSLSVASVHNLNTGLNYATIQEAINANETLDGHTIFIEEGTYYENVLVNKPLSLIGENMENVTIDARGIGDALRIEADNVTVSGFTIRYGDNGIYLSGSHGSTIRSNNITKNRYNGITGYNSTGSNIEWNIISNNDCGIDLAHYSKDNTIQENTVTNNGIGIYILRADQGNNSVQGNIVQNNQFAIYIHFSNGNNIMDNVLTNSEYCIYITSSTRNEICSNLMANNHWGMYFDGGNDNKIYHNNFIDNLIQAHISISFNTWDDGYPSGGNYWSDYNNTDSDHDGIGDTWYEIDSNNIDHYPLKGMFSCFNATSEDHVQTICNSSISNFQFNGTAVSFNVTGDGGTTGFCRICIPTALMNDTYRVFVNGTEILPPPLPLPCSNSTHSYLYFTYNHSIQEVVIIPEFPSVLILPLLMILTFVAVVLSKKKRRYVDKQLQ